MASVENSSTVKRQSDASDNSNGRSVVSSGQSIKSIQDGGRGIPAAGLAVLPQQSPLRVHVSPVPVVQVAATTNGIIEENFPALQNTTKPIPSSVFSYRFASPSNNQTPYYVSSDIVLSGGIAQQTRRRIVHNEVERRRKDKINKWIFRLADIVPQCNFGKQSKNIVLEKTVDYINHVNVQMKALNELQQREQNLAQEVEQLKTQIGALVKENNKMRDLLKEHRIPIPSTIFLTSTTPVLTANVTDTPSGSVTVATVSSSSSAETQPENGTIPPDACETSSDTFVLTQVPSISATTPTITTATACSSGNSVRRESVAYVAPFIIANAVVSTATNTAPVLTSASCCPVVQVTLPTTSSEVKINNNIAPIHQPQRNYTSRSGNQSLTGTVPNQEYRINAPGSALHSVYELSEQALQNANAVTAGTSQVIQSQTGYSQHSVEAIMNVSSQAAAGATVSTLNTLPLVATSTGQSMGSVIPCVVDSSCVSQSSVTMQTFSPASGASIVNQNTEVANPASQSVPTFLVATVLNQNQTIPVSKPNNAVCNQNATVSTQLSNQSVYLGIRSGDCKSTKEVTANKVQRKATTSRGVPMQNKTTNGKSSAQSKRSPSFLPAIHDVSMPKRTCTSQESAVNMDICRQEEILNIQNFSVSALIPSIDAQTSGAISPVTSTKLECSKSVTLTSTVGMSHTSQGSRLSHSIESLAGLSRNMTQPQSSVAQQVPHLGPGTLTFSAESLLSSSEDILSSIPHITTTSVSEISQNQQCNFSVGPSLHDPSSEQSNQGFSHFSSVSGGDLLSESVGQVMTPETQKQSRPSRTTYSDFSAESLIGSSDLNSGLSYAIDNLISSRPDPSYNSTAMVSVNPNLLHSMKSGSTIEGTTSNPLRALAAMPDLVEQKVVMPCSTSQPSVLCNTAVSNCSLGLPPQPPSTVSFSFTNVIPNSRNVKENTVQQIGIGQFSSVSANNAVSTSFLKHSVDSITSSFYTAGSLGVNLAAGSNPLSTTGSSFTGNSFGIEALSSQYIPALTNPFSPTKSFLGPSSTMGNFV